MNDDAINDPRYQQNQQREKRQQSGVESFIRNRLQKKLQKKLIQFVAKQVVWGAIRTTATLATNPWGIAIIVIVVLIIVLLYMFFPGADVGKSIGPEPEPPPADGGITEPIVEGLTISKIGDSQVEFGQNITYAITVSYDETLASDPIDKIVIVDKLPSSVEFVSATGTFTQTGSTIEWPLSGGTTSYSFTLVVKPTQDNIEIANTVFGRSLVASSKLLDSSASNLNAIFADAASVGNVPVALLKAIARIESQVLTYSSEEVAQFNSLNWWSGLPDDAPTLGQLPELIRRGYAYNTCAFPKDKPICPGSDVRGSMQFELGTWNGIAPRLSFADGHAPDRRYVRDIVYAAAYFLRGKIDQYDSRFNFTQNLSNLSETQVKALAKSYCGGNPDANTNQQACGFGAHEASAWAYYQEYNN